MAGSSGNVERKAGRPRRAGAPFAAVLGLVKGGALGAGAAWVLTQGHLSSWLTAALLGVLVGAVAGRAPWHRDAWIATLIKAVVGFFAGWGAHYAAARWPSLGGQPWIWLPAFGALWAVLVEIDDAVGGGDEPPRPADPPKHA